MEDKDSPFSLLTREYYLGIETYSLRYFENFYELRIEILIQYTAL